MNENPKQKRKTKKIIRLCLYFIGIVLILFFGLRSIPEISDLNEGTLEPPPENVEIGAITDLDTGEISNNDIEIGLNSYNLPTFDGTPYYIVNNNIPSFKEFYLEKAKESFVELSELDGLGRCSSALASIGPESLATEERGSIQHVKPTGWHLVRYDDLIADKYLYNRCHLLGYQLTGILDDERNLITGTRYLNVEGMLPYENMIASYVRKTGNHVIYSVNPVFKGDELLARGVHMQARSIEDGGGGILFNIYCYNAQPGIGIDYQTGDNWALEEEEE